MPSRSLDRPIGRFEAGLRWALLAVALVLPCLTGFATSYVLIALAALAAAYVFARRIEMIFDAPAKVFLGAFLAIALLFSLSARQPADVLFAVNFIAFALYAPVATLFGRAAAAGNAERVARLALLGTALGCAIGIFEVFVLGAGRAGLFITDTIRLADTAVLLGFLALIGIVVRTDRRRWLYLLGPVLALIVVLLTGARGAMLAYPVLALAAALFLVRHKWMAAISGLVVVGLLVGAGLAGVFGSERLDSMIEVFRNLATGVPVGEEAVRIRIELYKAGWAAFEQSPIIGHGWARLMSSVEPFLAEPDKIHATLPHLHNEMLNFAVFGGIAGVAIYGLLLAMPIVISRRSPRDTQYRARLFGSIVLVLGYIVMGLPDTMLSFELHTALYVGLAAVLLAFCRDAPGAQR
jgi:O-antigen ligase